MKTLPKYLSKSMFISGLQCSKLLWITANEKHLIPKADASTQAIFDQGQEVGDLAKKLFPDGIAVGQGVDDMDEVLSLTREATKMRKPLFEAVFSHQGCLVRADILVPVDVDAWDIVEVKSSTGIKNVYISDLAFQAFVVARSSLKIQRCILLLVNPDFVRHGAIDPDRFFVRHDVTDQVSEASLKIGSRLEVMFATIRLKAQPEVKIGPRCDRPYACALHASCWSHLPQSNVTGLYRGGAKGFQLLDRGITAITDIPDDFKLTANQQIQRHTARTGKPHVNEAGIRTFLDRITYPVAYIDFETWSTAIPLLDGLRPYQQVPFQFSVHIIPLPGAEPKHFAFLAKGASDPRPDFMCRLRKVLPENGSVIAFNSSFELSRLHECCESTSAFHSWVTGIEERMLDLLLPFRQFHAYHPLQKGSCSMKSILPAFCGTNYEHLEIQNGSEASLQFLRATFGNVTNAERTRIRGALDEYCHLDTFAMVLIIEALRALV